MRLRCAVGPDRKQTGREMLPPIAGCMLGLPLALLLPRFLVRSWPGSALALFPVPLPCSFDPNGMLVEQEGAARTVGTTVAVRDLFKCLPVRWAQMARLLSLITRVCAVQCSARRANHCRTPVTRPPYHPTAPYSHAACRHKEFLRHIKREYARLVALLQAYALIRQDQCSCGAAHAMHFASAGCLTREAWWSPCSTGVRIICTNQVGTGTRTTVVNTQCSSSIRRGGQPRVAGCLGVAQAARAGPHLAALWRLLLPASLGRPGGPTALACLHLLSKLSLWPHHGWPLHYHYCLRRDNILNIFGSKAADGMEPLHVEDEESGVTVVGWVSKATASSGRTTGMLRSRASVQLCVALDMFQQLGSSFYSTASERPSAPCPSALQVTASSSFSMAAPWTCPRPSSFSTRPIAPCPAPLPPPASRWP